MQSHSVYLIKDKRWKLLNGISLHWFLSYFHLGIHIWVVTSYKLRLVGHVWGDPTDCQVRCKCGVGCFPSGLSCGPSVDTYGWRLSVVYTVVTLPTVIYYVTSSTTNICSTSRCENQSPVRNETNWWCSWALLGYEKILNDGYSFVLILLLMLLFGSGWVEWEVSVAWVGLREAAAAVSKGKER